MNPCDQVTVTDPNHSLFGYVGTLIELCSVYFGQELRDGFAWVNISGIAGGTVLPLASLRKVAYVGNTIQPARSAAPEPLAAGGE